MLASSLPEIFGPDSALILFFTLLFFAAKRWPELGDGLSSALRDFLKAKDEIKDELTRENDDDLPRHDSRTRPLPRLADIVRGNAGFHKRLRLAALSLFALL